MLNKVYDVMTAVIGILNKQAVALAADSAVTVSGAYGKKIYNEANKVFALSKYQPVGIMIYNSSEFMGVPWETIIKNYRNKLDVKSFSTLNEYVESFIDFIKEDKHLNDKSNQEDFISLLISGLLHKYVTHIDESDKHSKKDKLREKFNNEIMAIKSNYSVLPSFSNYNFSSFAEYVKSVIELLVKSKNEYSFLDDEVINDFISFVYNILIHDEDKISYTGVVFVGYGTEEYFPSLVNVNFSIIFDNRLRHNHDTAKTQSISNQRDSIIIPYAQTDVIDLVLTGIDNKLYEYYLQNFKNGFMNYKNSISAILRENFEIFDQNVFNIDVGSFLKEIDKLNSLTQIEMYIKPLFSTVANLSKEDLADMAESMIHLTYLKRRVTNAEESVGGPVDVAVISKGDGFIWIKRKHYFTPELNQQFFTNYLKEK